MIKFNKGGLEVSEYFRVKHAIDIVGSMSMPPTAGFIEDGKDCNYIDFIYTKRECIEALDILREFVEEFAPDVEEEMIRKSISLYDDKYTVVYDRTNTYPEKVLRYGEEWRDVVGDNVIAGLCAEIERLEQENKTT